MLSGATGTSGKCFNEFVPSGFCLREFMFVFVGLCRPKYALVSVLVSDTAIVNTILSHHLLHFFSFPHSCFPPAAMTLIFIFKLMFHLPNPLLILIIHLSFPPLLAFQSPPRVFPPPPLGFLSRGAAAVDVCDLNVSSVLCKTLNNYNLHAFPAHARPLIPWNCVK